MLLLRGLESLLLNPSPECLEAVRPFLCLHAFSLCDSSNNLHVISRGECMRVRDSLCFSEWALALSLPSVTLPVCEELPIVPDECIGRYSYDTTFQPETEN